MSFIAYLKRLLVEQKAVYDLSRNQKFNSFYCIGFKESAAAINFITCVKADHLTERQIVELRSPILTIWKAHTQAGIERISGLSHGFSALDLDPDLEAATCGLGTDTFTAFRRVSLPLITPAMAVGAIIAFILSLNEVVIALFLSTPATETLPKVIWPNLLYTLTPLVVAASTITVVLTLLGLMFSVWLLRA